MTRRVCESLIATSMPRIPDSWDGFRTAARPSGRMRPHPSDLRLGCASLRGGRLAPEEISPMADHGFWTYARRDPRPLALVDPQEREWTRAELLPECNRTVSGLRALGLSHCVPTASCIPICTSFYTSDP